MAVVKNSIKYYFTFILLTVNIHAQCPDRITISLVDFSIERTIGVTCESFDSEFNGQVSVINVKNKKQITTLYTLLTKLLVDSTNYQPDIRLKMMLFNTEKVIGTLCMSQLGIVYNGVSYHFSEELHAYLSKISSKYRRLTKLTK